MTQYILFFVLIICFLAVDTMKTVVKRNEFSVVHEGCGILCCKHAFCFQHNSPCSEWLRLLNELGFPRFA